MRQINFKWVLRASLVAQMVKNPPAMQEILVQSLCQGVPRRRDRLPIPVFLGFPDGSDGKESTCNAEDLDSIPGLGRSPGGAGMATHSNILGQRNPIDRGAWWATVHGITKSQTQLSDFHFHFDCAIVL